MIQEWLKKKLLQTALVLLFFSSSQLLAEIAPSEYLLGTFGYRCPRTMQRSNELSMQSFNDLRSFFVQARNNPQCQSQAVYANLYSRFDTIYQHRQEELESRRQAELLEKKVAYYTQRLQDPQLDSGTVSYVQSEIIRSQAYLIDQKADSQRYSSFHQKSAQGLQDVILSSSVLLQQENSATNSCAGSPSLQRNFISQLMMTAASLSTGGTSLALAAGSLLMHDLGNFLESSAYQKSLDQMEEQNILLASRCVFEALQDQYCSTVESKKMIQQHKSQIPQTPSHLQGLDLLQYDSVELFHWLEKVISGTEISGESDRVVREKPILQENLLNQMERAIQGYVKDVEKDLHDVQGAQERHQMVLLAIEGIAAKLFHPEATSIKDLKWNSRGLSFFVENPVLKAYNQDVLVYMVFSSSELTVPTCYYMQGNEKTNPHLCADLNEYLQQKNITLNLTHLQQAKMNADDLLDRVLQRVQRAKAKNLSADPFAILIDVDRELVGQKNPRQGIQAVVDYATKTQEYLRQRKMESLKGQILNVQKTLGLAVRLQKVLNVDYSQETETLKSKLPEECQEGGSSSNQKMQSQDSTGMSALESLRLQNNAVMILSCVSKILQLNEYGLDHFQRKIRDIVSYDLEVRFKSQDLNQEIQPLLAANRADLVDSLLKTYVTSDQQTLDLEGVLMNMESSILQTRQSARTFSKSMSNSLENSLKKFSVTAEMQKDICFRLLPQFEDYSVDMQNQIWKLCSEQQMQSYPELNGPKLIFKDYVRRDKKKWYQRSEFSFQLLKPPESMMCDYRRYIQHNRLIEERSSALRSNFNTGK